VFAWIRVDGRECLDTIEGPVIFAANHQSYMDTPAIMAALPPRWRYRLAPAMAKEFFDAHFVPQGHGRLARFTNSLNYYLAALVFDAFRCRNVKQARGRHCATWATCSRAVSRC